MMYTSAIKAFVLRDTPCGTVLEEFSVTGSRRIAIFRLREGCREREPHSRFYDLGQDYIQKIIRYLNRYRFKPVVVHSKINSKG